MPRLVHSLPFISALAAALLPACASVSDFDVDRRIAEQRVQGSPIAGLLGSLFAVPIPMDVNIESETSARDAGPAQAARLKALALEITPSAEGGGDTDDFGFLDSVDVYIESTRSGTSLPRTLIAQAPNIQATPRIEFQVVGSVNVLPYAEEGSRFTSEVEGSVPPDDVSFAGHFTLRIELF
ncbi:MAG TPA: hypothetical protein VMG12_25745 [Polyangiaceae bacterium]|nr:hypothetical protein [Polyangiaceae bacterium]